MDSFDYLKSWGIAGACERTAKEEFQNGLREPERIDAGSFGGCKKKV